MNVTSRLSEMAAQMSWSALAIRAPSVVTPLKTGREQCPRCHLGRLPFPLLPFEMKHCWISFCGTSAVSEEDQNTSLAIIIASVILGIALIVSSAIHS